MAAASISALEKLVAIRLLELCLVLSLEARFGLRRPFPNMPRNAPQSMYPRVLSDRQRDLRPSLPPFEKPLAAYSLFGSDTVWSSVVQHRIEPCRTTRKLDF
ncbi:hypothetical protein K439DRAFT_244706 [Ramaria rubella]|nr:hypothetical protein K439DRAFT_244706 [Ramaria rubella]